jgi:hypothetical protein
LDQAGASGKGESDRTAGSWPKSAATVREIAAVP